MFSLMISEMVLLLIQSETLLLVRFKRVQDDRIRKKNETWTCLVKNTTSGLFSAEATVPIAPLYSASSAFLSFTRNDFHRWNREGDIGRESLAE